MAQINLNVGGRTYVLSCRDGEEEHLLRLAALIDRKCADATSALGVMPEPRLLLTAALLIADELTEAQRGATAVQPAVPAPDDSARLEAIAGRIENLCSTLERKVANA